MSMEYDSELSCEDRLANLEEAEERAKPQKRHVCPSNRPAQVAPGSTPWRSLEAADTQPRIGLGIANRSLSSQVMEYYHKYSRNSNLEHYFSLPTTSTTSDALECYYSIYDISPKLETNEERGQNYGWKSYVSKERRRWVRPPLIGQSVSVDGPTTFSRPLADFQSPSPELKHTTPDTILEEKNETQDTEKKSLSPTFSVTSHKPLEWDSGADVGYFNTVPYNKQSSKKLSTIERMALARGCSAALRLDPEGTTEPGTSAQTVTSARQMRPDAHSTLLPENVSSSESEVEITPIVKNHLPGVLTGSDIKSDEKNRQTSVPAQVVSHETPKSSTSAFKVPHCNNSVKYATEGRAPKVKNNLGENPNSSPLKKSISMNLLSSLRLDTVPKRSQSELNLCAREKIKVLPRLIFNSTSSIATVINKPTTCDKVIQTSLISCTRESIGVQVSTSEEEKPPLPKRGTSLTYKSLQSILKNPKSTYKLRGEASIPEQKPLKVVADAGRRGRNETRRSSSATSLYESTPSTPQPNDMEDVTGRTNSFEYFPGHIYENVPNETPSHVSSVETGRSNSTMPNTSSSIEEKLWGDSDSLVRDLERSVNILKSLVDANKCDKQVKKRLIHHVVKRLVSTKYTDDKIEHNLEENVPWNPDDARKKVYRAEIIHALAKKQNTTDSSDDWKPQRKKSAAKKSTESEARVMKEIINLESSSDKFDRNTDRTETDGRKARMGLRADDCQNSSNTPTDPTNKSESSECFLPQRTYKANKMKNMFCIKKCEVPCREHSMSNSTPSDQNRVLLETVVNGRQSPVESSNEHVECPDWKLPTTMSERQFELRRCNNSDSADAKLVSYAEMEKKNQLIWITNEISHLSNLKKLLEQPKKLERPKSSPRKSRHSSYKQKPVTVLACVHNENGDLKTRERDVLDTLEFPINKQWSSHGNLATYHSVASNATKSLRHSKKRNSCTQTGIRVEDAYSKTGAEIISVLRFHDPLVKVTNIYVQTSPQRASSSLKSLQRNSQQLHDACFENYKQACHCYRQTEKFGKTYTCREKTQNVTSTSCQTPEYSYNDERPIISQLSTELLRNSCICDNEDDKNIKQKETKNHLNSSKLRNDADKCVCDSKLEESKTHRFKVCELCSRKVDVTCRCEKLQRNSSNEHSFESSNIFQSVKSCEDTKTCKHCVGNDNVQHHLQRKTKCGCDKNCSCTNKIRDIEEKLYNSKGKTENAPKMSYYCCRSCGTAYQTNKKCGCSISFPKAVAYELSFNGDKALGLKHEKYEARSVKVNVVEMKKGSKDSESGSGTYKVRGGGCSCDNEKPQKTVDNAQKETLQDYLISNKPRFIDNIETRRQYISEISQLRQLRKEKRVQLLAISSTSNILQSPKASRNTKCVQKKITEESMKKRLRQRYCRLNEVRAKRRQREKEEQVRRNRLMARIFCKKLQQKVLRGQVDLSQSMSVISNL